MSTQMEEVARTSRRARPFLVGYGLSAVGSGMMLPFTVLFLRDDRGMAGVEIALFYVASAAASIAASAWGARHAARARTPSWLQLALFVQASGFVLLAVADGVAVTITAAVVLGAGAGLFYPKVYVAVQELAAESERRATFAARFLVTNAGLALGALLATVALHRQVDFRWLIAANVLSFAAFAAILAAMPAGAWRASGGRAQVAKPFSRIARRRPLRMLVLLQALSVTVGFSQLDSGIPLLLRDGAGFSPVVVGAVVTVGGLVVVLAQWPLTRVTMATPAPRLLALSGPVWALSYAALVAAVLIGPGAGLAALVVFCCGQAVAECLYSGSFQKVLVDTATPEELDAASAAASMAWSLASLIGPPLGAIAATGGPPYVLPVLCTLLLGATAWLPDVGLRAALDNRRSADEARGDAR